ncbi:hypothetical protein LC605_17250 [Nostoc sp. CHAB 5836]|nr:hypothetical protein [Nostoc sp. CHAB 5836]
MTNDSLSQLTLIAPTYLSSIVEKERSLFLFHSVYSPTPKVSKSCSLSLHIA